MKVWAWGLCLLVSGTTGPKTRTGVKYEVLAHHPAEQREYRLLRLRNGMEVLVGSDANLLKSLAVMDVRVGMRHDPPKRRGLAHLSEHMLFTKDFKSHISRNMGFYNAETGYEHTVFHFGVAPAAVNRTLAKFLAMLTKPHFDERRVQEEVGVVDQEFRDKLQDDTYRLDMISRVTGDANHPFVTNFGGNHETLVHHSSLSLQKALYSLHRSLYSSHRMRLVVMGPAPIDEQIETVVSLFDQVKESTFTDIEQADPFANEIKTTHIVTASVFESSKLLLQFKLPSLYGIYATKADAYISYMLRQSGPGSLLDLLRKEGWAVSIAAGISESNSDFSLYEVELALTPVGRERTQEIIASVLQAIALVRRKGITHEYFDEVRMGLDLQRIFETSELPLDQAMEAADRMHYASPHHVLGLDSTEFQFSKIRDFVSAMTLENLRVMLSYRSAATDRWEPIFGTNYSVHNAKLTAPGEDPRLLLPPRNMLFAAMPDTHASDLPEVFGSDFHRPQRIIADQAGEMWALPLDSPKSTVLVAVSSGVATLEQFAMLRLLSELRLQGLGEIYFHSAMAHYELAIEAERGRVEFSVGGLNAKIGFLLEKLIGAMLQTEVDVHEFEMLRQREADLLGNCLLEKPSRQAYETLRYALGEARWSPHELIQATRAIQHSQLETYAATLLAGGYLQFYLEGSLPFEDAEAIYRTTVAQLNLSATSPPPFATHPLPPSFRPGTSFFHRFRLTDKSEMNSGLSFYLHTFESVRDEATTRMLLYFLDEIFYDRARFVEQLGYDHNIAIFDGPGGGGLVVNLQGERDPLFAETRVENILFEFNKTMWAMDDEEFLERVELFIAQSAEVTLEARAQWAVLSRGNGPSDKETALLEHYWEITRVSLLRFLGDTVLLFAPYRRKLSIHAVSHAIEEIAREGHSICGMPIGDLASWRKALSETKIN